MSPPASESREAFHELLDLLREMGDRYAGPEWLVQEPDDVGEALRAVLHLLEAALLTRTESSPAHPWFREFPLPTRKFLGDNSDAIYYETAISPDHSYRLRGNMAGAAYVSITLEGGAEDGGFSQSTAGVINDTQFDVAADGSFEIRLGGEPAERNWLALPPEACRITTRHYFEDEVPAPMRPRHIDFQIEVLDPASAPAPPNDAQRGRGDPARRRLPAILDPGHGTAAAREPAALRVARTQRAAEAGEARRLRAGRGRCRLQHGALHGAAGPGPGGAGSLARGLPLGERLASGTVTCRRATTCTVR